MKVWTVLVGLAIAGMLASGVYAQGGPGGGGKGKGKGNRGGFAPATYQQLVDSTVIKDGDPVTEAAMVAYAVKQLPADPAPTDDQKDRAKTRATALWGRIVTAAAVAGQSDAATAKIGKDDYTKALANMPMGRGMGNKGGGGGGGGGKGA